jgi:hypothetical protein
MSQLIKDAIELALLNGNGLLIGRNGSTELKIILHGSSFEQHIYNTGLWPITKISLEEYRTIAIKATLSSDFLATGWYAPLADEEEEFLRSHEASATNINLSVLEPYFSDKRNRWTNCLEEQKVAIISPFAQLCSDQYAKRDLIWPNGLLPNMTICPIVTGFPPSIAKGSCEWPEDIGKWQDAVDYIVNKVITSGARIAIIGCGALGMIAGSKLKEKGIIVIVMGGALQVLFGLKGARWANHPIISSFWNDAWIYPLCRPANYGIIEGGCYW